MALVTDAYGGRGGIAQYNRDLFAALAGASEVEAIEILPRHAPGPPDVLPPKVSQHPAPAGRPAFLAAAARRTLAARPDVIFCGHINLAPPAALLARLTRARLVVQLHGIEAWEAPPRLNRAAVESADLVLCVSRYTRGRLLGWADIPPERAVVLSNTVDERFSPGDRAAARARFGLRGEKALLTVGRLSADERYKGHDRVIACLRKVREASGEVIYLIAGDGDDAPRLKALAEREGVAEFVRFLGHVEGGALEDLYRAADLFVMPSTGEGFGIVFLEAMASGTPALGLAEAGAVDALGDGALGVATQARRLGEAIVEGLGPSQGAPSALSQRVSARFDKSAFTARAIRVFHLLGRPQ